MKCTDCFNRRQEKYIAEVEMIASGYVELLKQVDALQKQLKVDMGDPVPIPNESMR